MRQSMDQHITVAGRAPAVRTRPASVADSDGTSRRTRNGGEHADRAGAPSRRRSGRHVLPPAPVKFFVALHADERIAGMSRTELIDLIRLSDLPPVCNGTWERLKYLERGDLERLAFLTRRCCRNQINSYSHHVGRSAPFIADM